jgi:hypothetical protein
MGIPRLPLRRRRAFAAAISGRDQKLILSATPGRKTKAPGPIRLYTPPMRSLY